MIVNSWQLITVRNNFAFSRYGASWEKGRNFTYPDGKPGLINGLVAEVPAGTDIAPFNALLDGSTTDPNCQSLSRYTPPSHIDFFMEIGGHLPSRVMTSCTTDAKMYDMAGGIVDLFSVAMPRMHCGSFSYLMGGIVGGGGFDVTPKEINIDYKSPRGGALEVVEYEQGSDGIVTLEIMTGAPHAIQARRLSDQSNQILAKGGLTLPAGSGQVKLKVGWASGSPSSALLAKLRFSIEVPYGI